MTCHRPYGNPDGEREGGIAGVGHAIDVFFAQQLTAAAPQRFHRSTGGRDAFRQSLLAIGKIVMRFGGRERHFRNASSRRQRIRQWERILLKNLQQRNIGDRAFRSMEGNVTSMPPNDDSGWYSPSSASNSAMVAIGTVGKPSSSASSRPRLQITRNSIGVVGASASRRKSVDNVDGRRVNIAYSNAAICRIASCSRFSKA